MTQTATTKHKQQQQQICIWEKFIPFRERDRELQHDMILTATTQRKQLQHNTNSYNITQTTTTQHKQLQHNTNSYNITQAAATLHDINSYSKAAKNTNSYNMTQTATTWHKQLQWKQLHTWVVLVLGCGSRSWWMCGWMRTLLWSRSHQCPAPSGLWTTAALLPPAGGAEWSPA